MTPFSITVITAVGISLMVFALIKYQEYKEEKKKI